MRFLISLLAYYQWLKYFKFLSFFCVNNLYVFLTFFPMFEDCNNYVLLNILNEKYISRI